MILSFLWIILFKVVCEPIYYGGLDDYFEIDYYLTSWNELNVTEFFRSNNDGEILMFMSSSAEWLIFSYSINSINNYGSMDVLSMHSTYDPAYDSDIVITAQRGYGFEIIDISDPYSLEWLGFLEEFDVIQTVFHDTKIYAALGTSGVAVYEAEDFEIEETDRLDSFSGEVRKVSLDIYKNLFVMSDEGMYVVDANDAYELYLLSSKEDLNTPVIDFVQHGFYCYVLDGNHLTIIDYTDPETPDEISSTHIGPKLQRVGLATPNPDLILLYILDQTSLRVYNVTSPDDVVEIGSTYGKVDMVEASSLYVDTFGMLAYIGDIRMIRVISVIDPFNPVLYAEGEQYDYYENITDITAHKGTIYVSVYSSLLVYEISEFLWIYPTSEEVTYYDDYYEEYYTYDQYYTPICGEVNFTATVYDTSDGKFLDLSLPSNNLGEVWNVDIQDVEYGPYDPWESGFDPCNCEENSNVGNGQCDLSTNLCRCNDNITGDLCDSYSCYGIDTLSYDPEPCNGNGVCLSHDDCRCRDDYDGNECQYFKCFGVWNHLMNEHNNASKACNYRGMCVEPDKCECLDMYTGKNCSDYLCFGYEKTDEEEVCSGHGNCTGADECLCYGGYDYSLCDHYYCQSVSAWEDEGRDGCNNNGVCASPEKCDCDDGFLGDFCYGWTCDSLDVEDEDVCNERGSCVSLDNCECFQDEEDELAYQYFGRNCEIKVGKILTVSTRGTMMIYFEISENDLWDRYGISVGEWFRCSLDEEDENMFFSIRSEEESEHGIDELSFGNTTCSLINTNGEQETRGTTQFLVVDISYEEFEKSVVESVLKDVHEVDWNVEVTITGQHSTLKMYPPFNEIVDEITGNSKGFTIRSFATSEDDDELASSSDDSEDDMDRVTTVEGRPHDDTDFCKSILFEEDNCIEMFQCYPSAGSLTTFEYYSIGYVPDTVNEVYTYSKFYFDSLEDCEEGVFYKSTFVPFSTLGCFGSNHGDRFVMYEGCFNNVFVLIDSAVISYFLYTTSPLAIALVGMVVFCLFCCSNYIMYCCREKVFFGFIHKIYLKRKRKKRITPINTDTVHDQKKEEEEQQTTATDSSDREFDIEELPEGILNDEYVKKNKKLGNESVISDFQVAAEPPPETETEEENGEQQQKQDDESGSKPVLFHELIQSIQKDYALAKLEEHQQQQEEEGQEQEQEDKKSDCSSSSSSSSSSTKSKKKKKLEFIMTKEELQVALQERLEGYEDEKKFDVSFPKKKKTLEDFEEENEELQEQLSHIQFGFHFLRNRCSFFLCCFNCCFPNCGCELLKSLVMIGMMLMKDGFQLWFASSEFLTSQDIDTTNSYYILLSSVMELNQYLIWVSIGVYLSILFSFVILYVGRMILDPLMFCVAVGSLKEYVYYRLFKSLFLLWFICVNLFCYLVKFMYLDQYEKDRQVMNPNFYLSIVFPELLLIFSLLDVLAYNGVSSHCHLKRLKKMGCCKGYMLGKFPKVNIGFSKVGKDPDVILEEFFQVLFLVEKNDDDIVSMLIEQYGDISERDKQGWKMIKKLSNSDEHGHLSWELLHGMKFQEVLYLKEFFFPIGASRETYSTIFHHHRILSPKWIVNFLFYPCVCILKR